MTAGPPSILISDFDGTITRQEFYLLTRERLLPAGTPDFWAEFLAGRLTHFEVLARYFGAIRVDDQQVVDALDDMQPDEQFATLVRALNQRGWQVIVASAGCQWYIDRILARLGVELTVHANPGHWAGPARGLVMERPLASPFYSPEYGIDKAALVRDAQLRAPRVAFAGDGRSDVAALCLVEPRLRFARGDAAEDLRRRGETFQSFERWSEVGQALLALDE